MSAREAIRLVVWDLDQSFWQGTLTEGGITYRQDHHDIVVTLARRGILSSICSKNDMAPVRRILEQTGLWSYFVFPSVNWFPKGQRIARLVRLSQLRPETVLFIDDNAANLAEAVAAVPGLQTAPETVIPSLLDDHRLRGRDDSGLVRLGQYRLLERRRIAEARAGTDPLAFLRASGIQAVIEPDVTAHLDRAVELIQRTNQLNFTKETLPESPAEARAALAATLADYTVQAGLLHVTDRYGDYGFCGLYVVHTGSAGRRLRHFCFSCRILGLGIETWLYRRLGRPALTVRAPVAADPGGDAREIDWIAGGLAGMPPRADTAAPVLDTLIARGGCELHAVTHYLEQITGTVHREFTVSRGGFNLRVDHTALLRAAFDGRPPTANGILDLLGFRAEDFTSALAGPVAQGRTAWLLSFWSDLLFRAWRHRETGDIVPFYLPPAALPEAPNADPVLVARYAAPTALLAAEFDDIGLTSEADFKATLASLLARAPPGIRIFVLLANDTWQDPDGILRTHPDRVAFNRWTRDVADGFDAVQTLAIRDFIGDESEVQQADHFDRQVYYRVFQAVLGALTTAG